MQCKRKYKLRHWMLTFLCVWLSTQVAAQRYTFYNLNVENGLIQSQVRTIAQDKYGYLWIGTLGGLSRYDGSGFTSFTVRDGLLDNEILTVKTDPKGQIWIGGRKGLSMYDGNQFRHIHFPGSTNHRNGIPVTEIHIIDEHTSVCIAGNQVYYIRDSSAVQLVLPDASLKTNAIFPDQDTLWVAGNDGHLYKHYQQQWEKIPLPQIPSGHNLLISQIFKNSKGRIWLATSGGLFYVNNQTIQTLPLPQHILYRFPAVLSITEDYQGFLWAGMASGVLCLTDSTMSFFHKRNGLSDNAFPDMLTDKEGSVWMATDGHGLFRFSGSQFTLLDESSGLPGTQVMCFETDEKGKIFIGTYDAGLYAYEDGKITRLDIPFKGNPIITSLCFIGKELWIGTAGEGIWRYDGKKVVPFAYNHQLSTLVTRIYKDKSQRIWIGTIHGLTVYDQRKFTIIQPIGIHIQDMVEIGKDSLLLATPSGLRLYQHGQIYNYTTGCAPDSSSLQCLLVQGDMWWIGTSDNGLIRYHASTHTALTLNKNNGLQSDFVYNLVMDNDSNIWAGTGYGLHKITTSATGILDVVFYGKNHGMAGMESNHNAVLKLPDGRIWFGTTNGAILYNPKGNLVETRPTGIIMQSVKLMGVRLLETPYADSMDVWNKVPYGLKLPHKKNNLSFTFHAITLSGDPIHYRYRIGEKESSWSEWSASNNVTFPSLQPGHYTLEVQCRAGSNQQIAGTLTYQFEIIPPFHQTVWFTLLILASFTLLGVMLQYSANRRKQKRKQLLAQLRKEEQDKIRQRTAEDFHDEIGNKLTRINILTNILTRKIKPDVEDAERIIRQIQENTAALYSGTRDIIWSLSPSNDNLYELLNHIRDFGEELFRDTEIQFHFEDVPEDWRQIHVPIDISRNLIMIFKEALHNSLKYANATSVSMKAYIKTTDTFEIRLIDNGIGFDLATVKKGQGLNNMELRAQRIGGWLYLQSEANKGTTILFSFRIPQ